MIQILAQALCVMDGEHTSASLQTHMLITLASTSKYKSMLTGMLEEMGK